MQSLLRALQLASPSMPVGAFSYSQSLERAVELGWVNDQTTARLWLHDQLALNLARNDAPLFYRLFDASQCGDAAAVRRWNAYLLATRESSELRSETVNMGRALQRSLSDSGFFPKDIALAAIEEPAYATLFAAAAQAADIPRTEALLAYLWAWLEGQVLAAMKLVPLGQAAGQAILNALIPVVEAVAESAAAVTDDLLSNFSPAFALASAQHESQYSRLFRS